MHLSVAIPFKLSVSKFMGYLKGKSTLMIGIPIYKASGKKYFGQEDIMWRQLVISPMKLYRNI